MTSCTPVASSPNMAAIIGRAAKALEPQNPSDWVDVQSFIWCVVPDKPKEVAPPPGEPPPPETEPPEPPSGFMQTPRGICCVLVAECEPKDLEL
jgi:hypothetical protein